MDKLQFELKLVEMVKSLPDYTEGHPCFTATVNPVCKAMNYKIGMGLSGISLLEIHDKLVSMKTETRNKLFFDIERDPESAYYGKMQVCFHHIHVDRGLSAHDKINVFPDLSKVSGVDLTVLAVIYEGDKKAVIFRPHWEGEAPFALPFKLLHMVLDKTSEIAINHRECTHEMIDQIKRGDIVTLPQQMPK